MNSIEKFKVSVIMPLYNSEKYIENSLISIMNQTHLNLEIILIDDGSTDKTLNICELYKKKDCRIKIICQENKGPGAARNNGLDIATGEFICFVDSDDNLSNKAIETMLLNVENDCDLIQCRSEKRYMDNRSDIESWKSEGIKMNSVEAMKDYLNSSKPIVRFSVWAKLVRKSAIGNLRFPQINNNEDVVFNAYLIDKCRSIKYIPDVLYYVRIREGSLSRSIINKSKVEASLLCNELILSLIKTKQEYTSLLTRMYWVSALTMLKNACDIYRLEIEDYREIIKYLHLQCCKLEIPKDSLKITQKLLLQSFKVFPLFTVMVIVKFKFI